MLFFIFKLECGFNGSSLVQKSPPHVDLAHIAEVEPNEVEGEIIHQVSQQLLHVVTGLIVALEKGRKEKENGKKPPGNYSIIML